MSSSGAYPQSWMDCNCPPIDSTVPNGNYFRAVENNPPNAYDFLNSVEADKFHKSAHCDRLAVSMLNSWEGAVHHLKLFSYKADWFIATSALTKDHGRVKNTPSARQPSHADWWPFQDVVRESTVTHMRKP